MKSIMKTTLALLLALALLVSSAVISVGAEEAQSDFTVTKISNPDRTFRMGDGLVEGGDRETSYAWCMTDRGDYVYIGTNKNMGGLVADALIAAFQASGVSEEMVWAFGNVLTNGEVPRPTTEEGGYILRCSKKTGKIEKLYTAPKNVSFRMAITHGGNVYFGSYASDGVSSNDILRVDENDNIETVFSSTNGTSMRAACILDDKLYFGGVDESQVLAEGDEECKKMAILQKDDEDDSVWNRVADYKDFGKVYTTNPGVQGNITSPIWDMCAYDGCIYATVPNGRGFAMFKGYPAADGEQANEYGWHWEEVIGFFNGVNNIGLFDDPQGNEGINRGLLSVTATPFVFNDELYVMDFDMTIYSEIRAVQGMVKQLLKREGKPSEYLASLYATMTHPQSVWKLDKESGKFIKSEGFSKAADNPCTEYLWRTAVYDGELYLGTMDSATIYNYVTRLTNGSFSKMTPEEWSDQLGYIKALVDLIRANSAEEELPEAVADAVADDTRDLAETAEDMIGDMKNMILSTDTADSFVSRYESAKSWIELTLSRLEEKISGVDTADGNVPGSGADGSDGASGSGAAEKLQALLEKLNVLKAKLLELYNSIDWDGLKMYAYISNAVRDDVWGFELYKTADGENYEPVTIDGFGDKYNYGARTLLSTDNGLYIGTANPFYGTQLFMLKNKEEKGVLGDADCDGEVTIFDTTAIQRDLADIEKLSETGALLADVDGDGEATIFDATEIQRWLADMGNNEKIGKPFKA